MKDLKAPTEIGNKEWKHSSDITTKCTWDEVNDFNQFLIEDFEYLSKQEQKIQQELMTFHKQNV